MAKQTDGMQARSSAVSSNLHSLLAFILYQEHPDCMMLSSFQDDVSRQPGSESLNAGITSTLFVCSFTYFVQSAYD